MLFTRYERPQKPHIDEICFGVVQMEDLYPIAEGGPKYRGKQSIKLRIRFEREGYGLNAQLGRTFKKKIKIKIWTTHLGGQTQGIRDEERTNNKTE